MEGDKKEPDRPQCEVPDKEDMVHYITNEMPTCSAVPMEKGDDWGIV